MVIDAIDKVKVVDNRRFGISGIKAISLRSCCRTFYSTLIITCTTPYLDSSKGVHVYWVYISMIKPERDRENRSNVSRIRCMRKQDSAGQTSEVLPKMILVGTTSRRPDLQTTT